MDEKENGMGYFDWLSLLFIGLKLAGVIDWSWLWVLCPIWIPVIAGIATLVVEKIK